MRHKAPRNLQRYEIAPYSYILPSPDNPPKPTKMEENKDKGRVCVTGGTGFVGSWMIKRLLEDGYHVNTTIRPNPDGSKKDISYVTDLPGAVDRLQIFDADLDNPDSFRAAIEGCVGVFHVAHPMDYEGKEPEELITRKSVKGILGILEACLISKTVKKVVYTSSAATLSYHHKILDVFDEDSWTDVDFVRKSNFVGASYSVAKTLTEKAALEFAEKHSLDLVTVIPPWIHGPFLSPFLPGSVGTLLALIKGSRLHFKFLETTNFVHVDDLARAHIYLFEHPEAKGRYICSSVEIKTEKFLEFLSARYPECRILDADSFIDREVKFFGSLSSKKLLDTGFVFRYGLEDMFDGAIECCKQKGIM